MRHNLGKIEFRLLGMLSIAAEDAGELALPRKNKAVLAALALAGASGLSREKLVDLFWWNRDEKQAQASLRQALAVSRKSLGPYRDCLQTGPVQISVDSAMIMVDALAFEALATSQADEDRDRALALYQGDLLDGARLKEEEFEAWIRPQRERLRAKAITLLSDSLNTACKAEQYVALASRLLELEPTNEAAHQTLMRTYAAQGRDNAALKQFIICRDLLDQELGVGPSRQTIVLFEEIKNKRRRPARSELGYDDQAAAVAPKAATSERSAKNPTGKPTIVVTPFENLSDEPGQAHFATGISYDIIAALLRHRWLSVINATNMSRAGRYAMVADGQVIESNVDYLITGSVRKAGNRLRIGVQMIATDNGEHIWSDSYDRQLDDIFEVQDEITGIIAGHIDVELSASERQRVLRAPTQSMGAWDCYYLGMAHFFKFTGDDFLEAQRLFTRSLELDPEFGEGHAWWSYINVLLTFYFDAEPTAALFSRALQSARRAVEIDDQNAMFHMLVARVYLARREYAKGMAEMEVAMELNPNLAGIYCGMGDALNFEGQYVDSIAQFDKALRLGPRDPLRWAYLSYGALAHLFAGNFESAIEWSEKAIRYPHCQYWAYAHRVAALGHLGRGEEARKASAELLHQQPKFSLSLAEKKLYFVKRPEQLQLYFEGLRKAGIPQ